MTTTIKTVMAICNMYCIMPIKRVIIIITTTTIMTTITTTLTTTTTITTTITTTLLLLKCGNQTNFRSLSM